jgi:prepilin-type N-terminal cleavage/methylation domain-containing protein
MIAASSRPGVSLVELLVVLAIIGVIAGLGTVAFSTHVKGASADDRLNRLGIARREALRTGAPVVVQFPDSTGVRRATLLPDGSAVGDSAFGLERLSGRPNATR